MPKIEDIGQVFLGVLRDDSARERLIRRSQRFNPEDWQQVFNLVIKNGLFPIFYIRLLSLNLENIPGRLLSRLEKLYHFNLLRNIALEKELFKAVDCLKENNISAIPLKGPVLARILYNDLALRQMPSDLDLLVRHEKVKEAGRVLKKIGYSFHPKEGRLDFLHRFRRQISLVKQEGNFTIDLELHWGLREIFTETHLEEFWANARGVNFDGHRIIVPSHEDLFLYLVLKAVFVRDADFVGVKYIYDIHRMLTAHSKGMDYRKIIDTAQRISLKPGLLFALRLSRDLFHTDIPDCFSSRLRFNYLKEILLKSRADVENILVAADKREPGYTWYWFTSGYLCSQNPFDFIKILYKKIKISANLAAQSIP